MTFETAKLTTLTGLILAAPALAYANLSLGETLGTTEAEIRAALEAKGYVVEEVELEDGEIEVAYRVDGIAYEAEIDPETGTIQELEAEAHDDDDDDDNGDDDDAENDGTGNG